MAGSKGSKYYNIFLDYSIMLDHKVEGNILNPFSFRLLKAILKTGSLKASALEAGVSYRKVWGTIEMMERKIGFRLVNRHRGGKSGGKTTLTEEGLKLIEAHTELRKEFDGAIYNITRRFFHSINH